MSTENERNRKQETDTLFQQLFQLQERNVPLMSTVRSKLTNAILTPSAIEDFFQRGEPLIIELTPELPLRFEGVDLSLAKNTTVDEISFEKIENNRIQVSYPAESNVAIAQLNVLLNPIRAINYIYSIIALITEVETKHLEGYLADKKRLTIASLTRFLSQENVELMSIASLHYGSPVSVDIIGLGGLVEKTYDLIQKVKWKDEYEREKALHEIGNARLDNILKLLDVIEKIEHSKLPRNQKDLLVSSLSRNIRTLLNDSNDSKELHYKELPLLGMGRKDTKKKRKK